MIPLAYLCVAGDGKIATCDPAIVRLMREGGAEIVPLSRSKWSDETVEALLSRIDTLETLLREADDYLDTHQETTIGSGSILHRRFKEAIR